MFKTCLRKTTLALALAAAAFAAHAQSVTVGVGADVTSADPHYFLYSPNQNIIKLYVNGVLENSMTPVAGATLNTLAETHVWLGVSGNNDATLNGGINELRIYEGASEVQLLILGKHALKA